MINFAWLGPSFRMGGGSSSINDLIDDPKTTVCRLLDQDSFVNEVKSGNAKVTEFMKYDKYETLVDYVTQVGPEDDRKRSYKYPLSACDVLSSDSQGTIEYFFPEEPLYVTQQVEEEEIKKPSEATTLNNEESTQQTKITSVEQIQDPITDAPDTPDAQQPVTNESKEQTTEQAKEEAQPESKPKKQTKTIKREVQPLSCKLFSYFQGEVNYTLAGYVCKIFGSFLTKKPSAVIPFLLVGDRFEDILHHIESRSVTELVVKILTHDSADCLDERKIAFERMLERASTSTEVYVFSNLSAAICQIIEKVATGLKSNTSQNNKKLGSLYFKPEIITKVIINVMSDEQNVSVYNAPILLTYLTSVPLILPENDQMVQDLKYLLQSFLNKALQKLQVTRSSRSTLGLGRVKIVQIMCFVLKQNVLQCQDLAANQPEFFKTLFALCQNYQLNNVLHNEVVKIIQIALSQNQTSPFLQKLLADLMQLLTEETKQDLKIKAGEGSQKIRKGYIGHIVQICRKLQQYAQKNREIQNFIQKPEFEFIMENLVNKEVYQNSKNLAGYGMNKSNKNTILFMKEEIIQEHLKFLMETPPSVYESELDTLQKKIETKDTNLIQAEIAEHYMKGPTLADLVIGGQEQFEMLVQEKVDHKYWNRHLEYNIDDLINDL